MKTFLLNENKQIKHIRGVTILIIFNFLGWARDGPGWALTWGEREVD